MLGRSNSDLVRNYRNLPLLKPPAGYVFILEDVDYGKRFKIGRCTHPVVQIDRIMAEYPFRTRIVSLERSDDARALEKELHRSYAGNLESGQWFDLSQTEIPEFEPADLGQPATLADLALNRVEGESLLQDERSATRIASPGSRHQPIARARRSPRRLVADFCLRDRYRFHARLFRSGSASHHGGISAVDRISARLPSRFYPCRKDSPSGRTKHQSAFERRADTFGRRRRCVRCGPSSPSTNMPQAELRPSGDAATGRTYSIARANHGPNRKR